MSVVLAQFFFVYFAVMAVALTVNKDYVMAAAHDIVHNKGLLFVVGFVTLVLGFFLVYVHNVWVMDWRVLITVLAWMTFGAGIVRMVFPDFVVKMSKKVLCGKCMHMMMVVMYVLAAVFGYYGYYGYFA